MSDISPKHYAPCDLEGDSLSGFSLQFFSQVLHKGPKWWVRIGAFTTLEEAKSEFNKRLELTPASDLRIVRFEYELIK